METTFSVTGSCDLYQSGLQANGFSERLSYPANKGFDWGQLEEHLQSMSLFGESRLIEVHLQALPDVTAKVLCAWAENPTKGR